jgi:hypothetical protein
MSEQAPQPEQSPDLERDGDLDPTSSWQSASADGDSRLEGESSPATGVPAVDEVVAEVDALDDRPLEEHLATFERAHERLRAALDSDPGDPTGRPGPDGASGPA